MARSDLLKKLFRGYKGGDNNGFLDAARQIIDEEKKKNHVILANELVRILDNGSHPRSTEAPAPSLGNLPKDSDRGMPLLEIRRPDRYFGDLVLNDEQQAILAEVTEDFRHWELLTSSALRPSSKLLFCGPPGCGKTVTAEALASDLKLPLLYVRFDSVVSSLLGETAANLRKVFDFASRDTWVLFFDEFDAIGRSRDDATEHGELKRVVNTFLQLLDRFNGRSLVIAATNFEQSLDPALWRRFDEILRFEKPSQQQIKSLLERLFRNKWKPPPSLDSWVSKLSGLSHAEVERIALDMFKLALRKGEKILTDEFFERALVRQKQRQQALHRSKARPTVSQ
jgi:SpoVK/Ycf46/Vps4 family AAA+-type ATPase